MTNLASVIRRGFIATAERELTIVQEGDLWVLKSKTGKTLYKNASKKKVQDREQEVNYFKHKAVTEVDDLVAELSESPSWEKIELSIRQMLNDELGPSEHFISYENCPWLIATYEGHAIYEHKGTYYEIDWSLDADSNVVLGQESRPVKETVSYVPIELAEWTTAFVNTLPDSSFAYVSSGGEKDDEGKTTPRSLRHLPYKDANGKVDLPHLRNALARLEQTDISDAAKASARAKLNAAAKTAGVGKQAHEFVWGLSLTAPTHAQLIEGKPIQIMKPGSFNHPEYGEFDITTDDMEQIVKHFSSNARKQDIPVDIDHIHEGGAVGWFKELEIKDDGLWAVIDWNKRGEELLSDDAFRYFSPHFGPWQDPETDEEFEIVLLSGAITNFPFLKEMEPIQLSEVRMSQQDSATQPNPTTQPNSATSKPDQTSTEAADVKALREELTATQALHKELREQIAAKEESEKALTERVHAMEHDGLVRRLTDIARGSNGAHPRFVGDEDQSLTLMVKLAETFGEESPELQQYVDERRAHAEQIKESGLLKEIGTSGSGAPSGTQTEFDVIVDKILAEGRAKSHSEALGLAAKENPSLYLRINNEHNRKAQLGES